jgi:hypothetical protein
LLAEHARGIGNRLDGDDALRLAGQAHGPVTHVSAKVQEGATAQEAAKERLEVRLVRVEA